MAKIVKLTDEDYSHLKELAKANGSTLAGEIRRMISLQRVVNAADVLGAIADRLDKVIPMVDRLEQNTPVAEKPDSADIPGYMEEAAREMGYKV